MLTGYPVLKVFSTVPAQHRAVSLIRVDLRFPEYMPATIMDTDLDSAVIFVFASLKAKFRLTSDINDVPTSVCVQPLCVISGVGSLARKRQETLSRDITAQQRYRCSPWGFHRSFFAGDTDQAGMV